MSIQTRTRNEIEPRELFNRSIRVVIQQLNQHRDINSRRFSDARIALDAMPLPMDEYAHAVTRLRNAERYVAQSECGAAQYELSILMRRFARA